MRKIVMSIMAIGVAAAMLGAGTMAYFNDTEQVGQNTITAGTLDLQVDGQEDDSDVVPITVGNIAPGWSQEFVYTLKNTGSLPGELSVTFSEIINYECGQNEPEALVDLTGGDPGVDNGELGDKIIVGKVQFRDGINRLYTRNEEGKEFKYTWKKDLNNLGGQTLYAPIGSALGILDPGESETFRICLRLDEEVGNEIQSDSVEFEIIFHLDQA